MRNNHRVLAYRVHEKAGTISREFTEAHASEARNCGQLAMLEKDGLTLSAAVYLVKKWNAQARAYGAAYYYSIPGIPLSKVMPA